MANWCYTDYRFRFDKEKDAKEFFDILSKAKSLNPSGQDFGNDWLGNVLIACDYPHTFTIVGDGEVPLGNIRTDIRISKAWSFRGNFIGDISKKGLEVTFGTSTAWNPMPEVLAAALIHAGLKYEDGAFQGVQVQYAAEEPGMGLYEASDDEMVCFGDAKAQLYCNKEKWDSDKRLQEYLYSDTFGDDVCEFNDDGALGEQIAFEGNVFEADLRKNILEFLNRYELLNSDATLADAVELLKEKYPSYDFEVTVEEYVFKDWLETFDTRVIEEAEEIEAKFGT